MGGYGDAKPYRMAKGGVGGCWRMGMWVKGLGLSSVWCEGKGVRWCEITIRGKGRVDVREIY